MEFDIDLDRADRPPAPRRGDRRQRLVTLLVLMLHMAIAVAVVVHGAWQATNVWLMVVVAVPFAQTSLIAIAAGAGRKRAYVRFGIAAAAVAWGWIIALTVLPGIALRSAESAGWAAGLAVQAGLIVVATALWQATRQAPGDVAGESGLGHRRRLQYDLASLLAWTTIAAVLLGLGRSASGLLGWGEEVTHWANFRFLPIIGGFNAAMALCVALALAGRRPLAIRLVAGGLIVALLGWSESAVLEWIAGTPGGLARRPALVLAGTQAALIAATLLPFRLGRP